MNTKTLAERALFPPILILLTLCLFGGTYTKAQPLCALTNNLSINTGYDPLLGAPIPIGTTDPSWTITAISPDALAACVSCTGTPPFPAYAEPPFSGGGPYFWVTPPPSHWVGFQTSSGTGYPTNGAGSYSMTLTREFRLCGPDNVDFHLQVAADNYITTIYVDATLIYSQPPTNAPSNYNALTPVPPVTLPLSGGLHYIHVTVENYPEPQCLNFHALNVVGNIVSPAGRLVAPGAAPGCICMGSGMLCDATVTLGAAFTATLMPNRDCEFLCTATATAGSGWTPVSYHYSIPTLPFPFTSYPGISITNTSSAFSDNATVWTPNGSGNVPVTVTVTFTNAWGETCVVSATRRLDCNGGYGFVYRKAGGGQANSRDNSIAIFPNPTNDLVTIESEAGTVDEVVVTDISGRKLAGYTYRGRTKVTLSLEQFPAGTYTIRVNNKESRLVSKTD